MLRPEQVAERLETIEELLRTLLQQRTVKEHYSTAEAAKLMGLAEWTTREYCRTGRLNAEKKMTGRGRSLEWMISHEEITRYRNEGLLPDPRMQKRLR
jgi:hypothetical protein